VPRFLIGLELTGSEVSRPISCLLVDDLYVYIPFFVPFEQWPIQTSLFRFLSFCLHVAFDPSRFAQVGRAMPPPSFRRPFLDAFLTAPEPRRPTRLPIVRDSSASRPSNEATSFLRLSFKISLRRLGSSGDASQCASDGLLPFLRLFFSQLTSPLSLFVQ